MRKVFCVVIALVMLLCVQLPVSAADSVYIVKSGDSLWSIANRTGTTVDNLMKWNSLSSDLLHIGDQLVVSPPSPQVQAPAPASQDVPVNSGASVTYVVKANDNMWNIAMAYGISVDELKAANNKTSDFLQIGDVLIIPESGTRSSVSLPSRSGGSREIVQSAAAGQADAILQTAGSLLGTPYRYSGQSPGGFDCSGFVFYVFSQHGYSLPRTAAAQAGSGYAVDKSELLPADIVYFRCGGGGIDHSGIYVGNNQFIHSSSPSSGGVIYSSLNEGYYARYYSGARRVI
ncbi:MAG: LysM peptidoglycan-binding domain-containing protein [Syntrophomonadaceae bacterium]|jgi:peptidoglycan endopeptidase LytE|nr:LysM peptidoglycan-binding domain-containing protein [Syntrophomonadaceae bacterium]